MTGFFDKLRRNEVGAPLVEFALTLPIIMIVFMGAFGIGNYMYAKNAVNHALDEAARTASIFPTPTDAKIKTAYSNALTRDFTADGGTTLTPIHGKSGTIDYVDLKATASIDVDFAFYTKKGVKIEAKRRVFVAN
ncbi:pilus assembly protein [Alteriqipengyuania flavescens]|uniref:TadE/TadG family type IV pilus assembly protein n=1 Tax=Alteriqipengyuania flavescens TaxID=3053610 RepID=UPI0025B39F54|nr:TadE/TadG family type IV pilus assembly protein [Alteriqipengyuania flavescens]WJY19800.1 pilus assembly protein [Alteriqipengyuania flavescens]WJY25742.1 pilus assembly protein [Alteriqipengyuania flavescens]